MRRRHRYPRKSFLSYVLPFFVIFIIAVLAYYAYNFLIEKNSLFVKEQPEAYLYLENGSAQILLWGKDKWYPATNGLKLFQGDAVKIDVNSRGKLQLFDQSILRLDQKSHLILNMLRSDDMQKNITLELKNGNMWAKIEESADPKSSVEINTDYLKITTKGSIFTVAVDSVRVFSGKVLLSILHEDSILQTIEIGVGQEIVVSEDVIEKLKNNEDVDILAAISDDFKKSNWYRWNKFKDNEISSYEEEEEDDDDDDEKDTEKTTDDVSSQEKSIDDEESEEEILLDRDIELTYPKTDDEITKKKSITIEGKVGSKKVETVKIGNDEVKVVNKNFKITVSLTEGKNSLKIKGFNANNKTIAIKNITVTSDITPPESSVVITPTLIDDEATIDTDTQKIIGTVEEDVYKVIVNDYVLSKYVPGSKTWQYYAKSSLGNLKKGENEYTIIAEDKAGNQSAPTIIKLIYESEEEDDEDNDDEDNDDKDTSGDNQADGSSPGSTFSITEPNGGKDYVTNEEPIYIEGTASKDTHSIQVNDYKLQAFEAGQTTWKYQASTSIGNLEEGVNVFTISTFDKDSNKIAAKTLTITYDKEAETDDDPADDSGEADKITDSDEENDEEVEKVSVSLHGSIPPPIINFPSQAKEYQSSLEVINIGGTTSENTDKLYINDTPISYSPGSTKWKYTVTLKKGNNNFSIYAVDGNGNKSKTTSIMVIYK